MNKSIISQNDYSTDNTKQPSDLTVDNCTSVRQANVPLTDKITLDGYQMPDGNYRISISSASVALGYQKNWLSLVTKRGTTTFKALQGIGFNYSPEEVKVPTNKGLQKALLTTLTDFSLLMIHAVMEGKKEAIALNVAL